MLTTSHFVSMRGFIMKRLSLMLVVWISSLLVACSQPAAAFQWPNPTIDTTLAYTSYTSSPTCQQAFVAHPLAHTTLAPHPVRLFASNGSGVAVGDLDNDGLLDIVLANLAGPTTLALNQGAMTFRETPLDIPFVRAIAVIDVNGDGLLDIAATHYGASLSIHLNQGTNPATFRAVQTGLPTVRAYSMLWHDFNHDGRLDVVTGSYDAETPRGGAQSLFDDFRRGVFVHTQQADGSFVTTRLSDEANALALMALDINGDGNDDIVVGNDFDLRDHVWLWHADRWEHAANPFDATPHSTMSYDVGDLNHDGQLELLAADMNPYQTDVRTLAAWLPVTSNMTQFHPADDPQLMENAILMRQFDQRWRSVSREVAGDATGWSWSTRWVDFDRDGLLDLYAVNGMIAEELFPFLPNYELVEHNQALRFDGQRYQTMPAWQLDSTASGRGMTVADLDDDGDLDVVVNNLQSASMIYENRLCTDGTSITLSFRQHNANPWALGTQVRVYTDQQVYTDMLLATRGYLSGTPPEVVISTGNQDIKHIDVRWPDGQVSRMTDIATNQHITVTRNSP